ALHGVVSSVASKLPSRTFLAGKRSRDRAATDERSAGQEPVFTITGIRVHHAGISVHDDRNRCSPSVGIGVHVRPEWVFTMVRNTQIGVRALPDCCVMIDGAGKGQ